VSTISADTQHRVATPTASSVRMGDDAANARAVWPACAARAMQPACAARAMQPACAARTMQPARAQDARCALGNATESRLLLERLEPPIEGPREPALGKPIDATAEPRVAFQDAPPLPPRLADAAVAPHPSHQPLQLLPLTPQACPARQPPRHAATDERVHTCVASGAAARAVESAAIRSAAERSCRCAAGAHSVLVVYHWLSAIETDRFR
jgi:hypothetical protein